MRSRTHRIYSETAPYDIVAGAEVLGALAKRNIELVLAVRPWDVRALPDVAQRCTGAGVVLSIWPMLADDDGRFIGPTNVARARELTLRALDACAAVKAPACDVLLDVEPPVDVLRAGHRGELAPVLVNAVRSLKGASTADRALMAMVRDVTDQGVTVTPAVVPWALWEPRRSQPLSRLFGTAGLGQFDTVDVMTYTTLLQKLAEPLSRGRFRREHALAMLSAVAKRASAMTGPRMRIALGCVGVGAMGDEGTYRDVESLAEDVRVASRVGANEFALLDLGGALLRRPLEAWLDAFTAAE